MTEQQLLDELHAQLVVSHQRWGVNVDPIDQFLLNPDFEVYRTGKSGVLAFFGDYVVACAPDIRDVAALRETIRLIGARLEERGYTRHMVHPLNFRSVVATRKMGAVPDGVDADGFVHYTLTRERFLRGKKVATAEGP